MNFGKTFLTALLLGLFMTVQAMAADVSVLTEVLDGFSRISIGSEFPLNPKIEKTDRQITVDFGETVNGNFSVIPQRLSDSVAGVSMPGNRRLLIRLKRPFVVRDYVSGGVIQLELLGANDPKKVETPSAKQLSAGRVKLYAIQRAGEDQLVFSFPEKVNFKEQTTAGRYELAFDVGLVQPQALKLEQVLTAFPAELQQAGISEKPDGTFKFTLSLPAARQASAVQNGRQITVSVSQKKAPAPEKTKPASADPKPAVKPEDKKEPPVLPAAEATPDPAQTEKAAAEKLAAAVSYSDEEQNISLALQNPSGLRESANETEIIMPPDTGYRSVSLSFPWTRMTAAAAFRRQGYLWLVFDRKGEFNFDMELEIYKDIIYEIVQVPHSKATIFRLVTAPGYNPSMRREGLLWVVDLMYQKLGPKRNVELILQRKTPFGPRIFIPLDEVPEIIPIIDPEVGDFFYIVPIFSLGKGLAHQRSFVDATFLPSAQGLAIVPNIEELSVYSSASGLEVRGPAGGLRFSSEDIISLLAKKRINTDPMAQLLDVGVWALNNDAKQYLPVLKQLQMAAAQAEPEEKPVKRLILARYYFANGFYPEALGILRSIEKDMPEFAEKAPVVALRGAANFMMQRYREALQHFNKPVFSNEDAILYWKAAAMAGLSRTPEKFLPPLRESMSILQSYPQIIKTRLALAGLHAAVAAGDEFSVQNFMEAAYSSQNSPAVAAEIKFYHALWQEMNGLYAMAQKEMETLANGTDYYFRAMGGLEKIRMETRMETMTPEQRIEELERLSYAWRGDDFEYNLMTMLVAAYQDQKDYAQVLHTLKSMQVRFADLPESKKIPKIMSDLFEKIYLSDEDHSLSPIKAIALFDEFRDLLPKGEKGAQIVRRLADKLVAIDLLDRASFLLEQQLKQPIGSPERGLVATRLALVRLLNREPEAALKALEISENGKFSEKVQKQRRHMKAKALADLNKPDEAAALLEEDDSDEAKLLRAEIYWQAQIWDKAADSLKLLIKRPDPNVPLTEEEAQRVLNWAAALRLAGRPKVVIRLRENFLPYMRQTDLAEAFDFITTSPQQGVMDYRQVAKEVESAESFNTFAKSYTDLVKTQGLSQAVQ